MATGMHMDKRNVDCLVLGHHDQDRKVSAKSVTMRAMTLCKNLSGYRELLLINPFLSPMEFSIKIHLIKSGWSIVYIERLQVIISKKNIVFLPLKINFVLNK